ncbi:MAG: AAA family ATPase [Planctomycetes bacterium]|nr:AAA family ATPase [Planctomycetota bacterium]MBI3835816.1 AAA family ATPase [Planctomycetota bacterium]
MAEFMVRRSEPVLVRLADVQPEPVSWLWPGRIALGKLTLIAGDPGLGKSFLTLDIAARVSCGSPWPDLRDKPNPPGGVILLARIIHCPKRLTGFELTKACVALRGRTAPFPPCVILPF